MSLSVSGIGSVQPVFAPSAPAPYASNSESTASVVSTTTGAEAGAAAVVYEPGPSDAGENHTYANRSAPAQPAPQTSSFVGDEAVVEATGGTSLPPPELPETPHQAEIKHLLNDVWAPVGPINIDPAAANVGAQPAPPPAGQAEASAQASYAAVADAQVAGASVSDVEKFA
ncbi:MAG: hypothetical protein J7485_01975 [Sphingobium sp.]|nr:hypothetical protein [Sphingobium sp.]